MKIFIDSREKDRKQRALDFYIAKGHEASIQTLEVGDYIFFDDSNDNKICFEYKTINDMMSSIKNESLFNEATNQALEYKYHYVIIVGELKHYITINWNYAKQRDYPKYVHDSYAMYYGALRRLRTFTTTIEVDDENQAFAEMYLQAEKCLDGKSKFYSNVTRPLKSQNPCEFLLGGVKGIKAKRIQAIIEHHNINNLYDLLALTVPDFKAVKGIGDKTAQEIFEFIHVGD